MFSFSIKTLGTVTPYTLRNNFMHSNIFISSFVNRHDEAFSTEPLKNNGKGASLNFYHVQNITATITRSFIEYIKTQPMIFEVYGHYQQHQLTKVNSKSDDGGLTRPPPRRLLPPAIPISQPVRSSKFRTPSCPTTSHLHSKHDLIVWFEILELGKYK